MADEHQSVTRLRGGAAGVEPVSAELDRFAERWQLPGSLVPHLHTVLDEVVSNILRHGRKAGVAPSVDVTLRLEGDRLGLEIVDDAAAFNPLEVPPPTFADSVEESQVGGLGIFIVRFIMDEIDYDRRDGKNRLRLYKKLPS
jgi:anti-sigma regulatory factor (Ser/Thr protein kinase)